MKNRTLDGGEQCDEGAVFVRVLVLWASAVKGVPLGMRRLNIVQILPIQLSCQVMEQNLEWG